MAIETTQDPGFGEKIIQRNQENMINALGGYNVVILGAKFSSKDIYMHLTKMSWAAFLALATISFLFINLIYAIIYCFIGEEAIVGNTKDNFFDTFWHAYFFSTQTFTTVGYGVLAPHGFLAHLIAALEAFTGLLWFALITGLLYGRFSRPTTRIAFSKNIIIAPYKGITSLQLRIVNERKSAMTEIFADLILSINEVKEDGTFHRNYYSLALERNSILFFPLPWTIVHPIDENSPFFGKTEEEIKATKMELFVFIKGYDDTFKQTVPTTYSYLTKDLVWGARFARIFHINNEGKTILEVNRNDDIELVGDL